VKSFNGSCHCKEEKITLLEGGRGVWTVSCVTTNRSQQSSRILTRFPSKLDWTDWPFRTKPVHLTQLRCFSVPTNPCPIAVNTEPFSTSVLKDLICILATTTKICTTGCSNPTHVEPSQEPVRPPTHPSLHLLEWSGISNTLYCHPFSGLRLSAG
jgi:hypothetical protein